MLVLDPVAPCHSLPTNEKSSLNIRDKLPPFLAMITPALELAGPSGRTYTSFDPRLTIVAAKRVASFLKTMLLVVDIEVSSRFSAALVDTPNVLSINEYSDSLIKTPFGLDPYVLFARSRCQE